MYVWVSGARPKIGLAPAYKPTSVLTNHSALESVLQTKCGGGHRHVQLVGKQACSRAAVYPRELCAAIVMGAQIVKVKKQETLEAQNKMVNLEMNPVTMDADDYLFEVELEDMCEEDPSTWEELANERWSESTWPADETRYSTSGELLDPKKVQEGCNEELGFMSQMGVWDRVTREKARNDPEGKIVGTRWVFVKKGDKVRCRLVAQEFAGNDKREDLYAGTPPLAATRYLLSDSVSRGRRNKRVKLMVVDVKRAFLHGYCTRSIYIELPGVESQGGEICGQAG